MKRRIGNLVVSFELLREALHLPPETKIHVVGMNHYRQAILTVEHPDLKPVAIPEGAEPPSVSASFRKQEPIMFIGWSQE